MKQGLLQSVIAVLLGCGCWLQGMTPDIEQAIGLWEQGDCESAFKVLWNYKDSTDVDALAYLGRCYYEGKGVKQDFAIAYEYFQKAAKGGQPYGLNGMGDCLMWGHGVKQDLKLAEEILKKAAQAGCPLAEYNLGLLYSSFRDNTEFYNLEKASAHFKASYEAGNLRVSCASQLGIILHDGKEPFTCVPYLEEAADGNDDLALSRLAIMYEKGDVVPVDRNRAIDYAERYARKNNDWHLYIDICYRTGLEYIFHFQNREGVLFMKMAADAGDTESQYQVSLRHPDETVRGEYALKAYKGGCSLATVEAGRYLAKQKQYDKAMKLYQEAAKDGDPQAMCEIAYMYQLGEGVEPNYETSMEWYRKAADMYYSPGLRNLGDQYYSKYVEDIRKDFYTATHPMLSKALACFALACLKKDDEVALDKLDNLLAENIMETVKADNSDAELAMGLIDFMRAKDAAGREKGINLVTLSASHGNVDAMNALGYIYRMNEPVLDVKKSADYYTMAAAKGNDYAEKQLLMKCYEDILGEQAYVAIMQKQSDKGDAVANNNLGVYYDNRNEFGKAAEYYLKAVRTGVYCNLNRLVMLKQDKHIAIEEKEYINFGVQALTIHDANSEYNMGMSYIGQSADDQGNPLEARKYLMRAIIDGSSQAAPYGRLGMMYLMGQGVRRDTDYGIILLQIAVDRGGFDYCAVLADVLKTGDAESRKDPERAKAILELGAKNGDKDCQELLKTWQEHTDK